MISSYNPATGARTSADISESTAADVEEVVTRAAACFARARSTTRSDRAAMLRAIARAVEERREELVAVALEETGLAESRLHGELTRSIKQFELFADCVEEGSYLEATLDTGDNEAGIPDIRRMLIPLGPVAVFGSSNFPFAFSVLGGDVASALAAGCAVIVKAHPGHPRTSRLSYDALTSGLRTVGVSADLFGVVFGHDAGIHLVANAAIAAVGLTGSREAGMALQRVIDRRDRPIPLYAELSSVNPFVLTEGAVRSRSSEIARGLFHSFTDSSGQLCTKPGVIFVPREASKSFVADLIGLVASSDAQTLLNPRVRDLFLEAVARARDASVGVSAEEHGRASESLACSAAPSLLMIEAKDMTESIAQEAFGPFAILVTYDDMLDLTRALAVVPDSLTATIHHAPGEEQTVRELTTFFESRVGRIVFNGYPTGVRVSWAQHHGGPWPATNSIHTSVGMTAIRRFLRPFAWQNAPATLIPQELTDGYAQIPRRIDGQLVLPS